MLGCVVALVDEPKEVDYRAIVSEAVFLLARRSVLHSCVDRW